MIEPVVCRSCSNMHCEKGSVNVLRICDYGVAYYNDGIKIEKKEERVTLRDISTNLRHELHKVLQTMVTEANKIDPDLSSKVIDLDNPASRIVGATIILDQFIEMITGVHTFHPSTPSSHNIAKKTNLHEIIQKYINIFSLIQNTRRNKELNISVVVDDDIVSSMSSNIIEYILSILVDNLWKYSISDSEVKIIVTATSSSLLDIKIVNESIVLENIDHMFIKGYQGVKESEGFGYGLYWLTLLVDQYNRGGSKDELLSDPLKIEHTQTIISNSVAEQTFILRNIRFET